MIIRAFEKLSKILIYSKPGDQSGYVFSTSEVFSALAEKVMAFEKLEKVNLNIQIIGKWPRINGCQSRMHLWIRSSRICSILSLLAKEIKVMRKWKRH